MKLEYHKEYQASISYWKQIRAFVSGKKEVQEYLQNVTTDKTAIGVHRNQQYKERAKFVGFPARTRNAFIGSVFRLPPQTELPSSIDYLQDKANRYLSLEQLSKRVVTNLIEVGRTGILSDYSNNRSNIVTYTAENIINWKQDKDGVLVQVDLKMSLLSVMKRLILRNGLYEVDYFEIEGDELQFIKTDIPLKGNGARFEKIPFVFCGSTDNDPSVDDMPLWSIVDVTQGHYQNSADYEDFLRYLVPTPAVTVPNKDWLDEMLPNGYTFGDGSIIPLPEGGTATMLQATENPMHLEAMKHKEDQLIALGARIISGQTGQAETAEAVRIRFSSENSILDNLAGNASNAIRKCIEWCYEFEDKSLNGSNIEITFELNREFVDTKLSAQEITAQILLLDRGIVGKNDIRDNLRQSDFIAHNRSNDDLESDSQIEAGGL